MLYEWKVRLTSFSSLLLASMASGKSEPAYLHDRGSDSSSSTNVSPCSSLLLRWNA